MRNIQDTFKTRKRSFISAFLICMTVPLTTFHKVFHHDIAMFAFRQTSSNSEKKFSIIYN